MPVYTKDGQVLLTGGLVATDAACCCNAPLCCIDDTPAPNGNHYSVWSVSGYFDFDGPGTCDGGTCTHSGTYSYKLKTENNTPPCGSFVHTDCVGSFTCNCNGDVSSDHYETVPGGFCSLVPDGGSGCGSFGLVQCSGGHTAFDYIEDSGTSFHYDYWVTDGVNHLYMYGQEFWVGSSVCTGACCIDSACSILTPADCESATGTFQGLGTTCDPDPCAPTGACCVGEDCSIHTASDCSDMGGVYQGDDSPCSPNPCGPCAGTEAGDVICCWTYTDEGGSDHFCCQSNPPETVCEDPYVQVGVQPDVCCPSGGGGGCYPDGLCDYRGGCGFFVGNCLVCVDC